MYTSLTDRASIKSVQELGLQAECIPHTNPKNGSAINNAVHTTAQSLLDATEGLGTSLQNILKIQSETPRLEPSSPTGAANNVVTSQQSEDKCKIWADMPINDFETMLDELHESTFELSTFLPDNERARITVQSTQAISQQKRIGLLRAPNLDESTLVHHEYNFSMVKECLVLGTHLKNQFNPNTPIQFKPLWAACKEWRLKQLNVKSSHDELENFSSTRTHEYNYSTAIEHDDVRYNHLLVRLTQCAELENPHRLDNFQSDVINIKINPYRKKREITIQHALQLSQRKIPLTKVIALVGKNLSAAQLQHTQQASTANDQNIHTRTKPQGVIFHINANDMAALILEIESKLARFSTQFQIECTSQSPLQPANLTEPRTKEIVKSLSEVHYLLAHLMFDERGSAAKSELFIRSLAVCAGIELPAFKQAYVPDLEAFLNTPQDFSKKYLHAFETHVTPSSA